MAIDASQEPTVGILTRTLSVSPVIRWILPLFKSYLVCVGHGFVHLYSINAQYGWIQYEESFPRIPGRILCAVMSSYNISSTGQPQRLNSELILTLERGIILTFGLEEAINGVQISPSKRYPLPRTDDPLQTSGTLLAAETHMPTVVVGSCDCRLIFFHALPQPGGGTVMCRDDCSYSALTKSHKLLRMAFLQTARHSDPSTTLLLVTSLRTKLFAHTLEWTMKEGKATTIPLNTQRIDLDNSLPDLLIPSKQDQVFVLAASTGLFVFDEILSGHAKQTKIKENDLLRMSRKGHEGLISWISWVAHPSLDTVLIFGEDGRVVYFDFDQYWQNGPEYTPTTTCCPSLTSYANVVHWFAGDGELHYLVVRGLTGQGGVYRIILKIDPTGGEPTTLIFDPCQTFTGWALQPELVVSRLPRSKDSSTRRSDGLFVAHSSHDRADIIELRPGAEAYLAFALDIGSAFSPTKIWTEPLDSRKESVFLLSGYGSNLNSLTKAVIVDAEGVDMIEHADLSGSPDMQDRLRSIDLFSETVHVSTVAADGSVFHVTRKAVTKTSPTGNSGTSVFSISDHDAEIIAADILASEEGTYVVLVTSNIAHDMEPPIRIHFLLLRSGSARMNVENYPLTASVTAIRLLLDGIKLYAVVATRNGDLAIYSPSRPEAESTYQFTEQAQAPHSTTIETIEVIIASPRSPEAEDKKLLVLYSLRNGNIEMVELQRGKGPMQIQVVERISLGVTTVLLTPLQSHDRRKSAAFLAACESSLFTVTVAVHQAGPIFSVHPLWIIDRDEPGFAHDNISAITQIKHHNPIDGSDLFGHIAVVMGSKFLIATAPQRVGHPIPRTLYSLPEQKPGSPVRMLYSSRLAHFVLAVVERGERTDTNTSTRYFRSYVEYRPISTNVLDDKEERRPPVQALLEAGEKVNSLAEWVYHNAEKKKYVFTLVGTDRTVRTEDGKSTKTRGRIHILQPTIRSGRVDSINFSNYIKFDDPVYAIAMVSPVAFVCSHGNRLSCYLYSAESRKWQYRSSARLSSPATNITFDDPFVHVTTTLDSVVVFWLIVDSDDLSFIPIGKDSSQALGMHHQSIPISWAATPPPWSEEMDQPFISVMSTKTGQLHGLLNPGIRNGFAVFQSRRLFTAQLPHAVTRLRIAETSIDPLVKKNSILGIATDGTIYGASFLDVNTWARLKYLEALILRSEDGRPPGEADTTESHTLPRHSTGLAGLQPYADEPDAVREGRTGFSDTLPQGTTDTDASGWRPLVYVPMPSRLRPEDMHVDGDVLNTLFVPDDMGPVEKVRRLLKAEAENADAVGRFVREHIGEEMQLVPETVKLAQDALRSWGFW